MIEKLVKVIEAILFDEAPDRIVEAKKSNAAKSRTHVEAAVARW